jgi:DNA-binding transcriptional regulator YiaG
MFKSSDEEIQRQMEFMRKHEPKTRDDFFADVITQLREERYKQGLTQERMNSKLGIADRLINKWECGIKSPSGFSLYCWADALDCDILIVPRGKDGE